MDYIRVTKENLGREHICCAISNDKDIQVSSKKAWLAERFDDGLVFLKSVERGKCFIEYLPAENAWCPIEAEGYLYIDCLWVSGSLKGHGYANDLLGACVEDAAAQGKAGLCILSSAKKRPFLADPGFLSHKGFSVADEASGGVELWYLPLSPSAKKPSFRECAKRPIAGEEGRGYLLYYTDQCPFNAKYVPLVEQAAKENGIPFRAIRLTSKAEAQSAPAPVTTYSLFYDGVYLTNEQMNGAKFLKLAAKG